MGLVLRAGDRRFPAMSYADVHLCRALCLRAFADTMDHRGLEDSDAVRCYLQGFDAETKQIRDCRHPVDCGMLHECPLRNVSVPDELRSALCGLEWWVNHPDDDDFHSVGQCGDIAKTLSFCLEALGRLEPDKRRWWRFLRDFYAEAAVQSECVLFV